MSRLVLEVEVKLPLADADGLRGRLAALGAEAMGMQDQRDVYFQHPERDLVASDEALRARCVDGAWELTYKGPRQDAAAKVRREINLDVGGDPTALLKALGFASAVTVKKRRETWRLDGATVAIDDVTGVGRFVEVEVLDGSPAQVEAVVRRLGLDMGSHIDASYAALVSRSTRPDTTGPD